MDLAAKIFGGVVFLAIFGWMTIRPYLYYRDLISGAIAKESNDSFIIQGCLFGGVGIYLLVTDGIKNTLSLMTIILLFLISAANLYFEFKIRSWKKNNK